MVRLNLYKHLIIIPFLIILMPLYILAQRAKSDISFNRKQFVGAQLNPYLHALEDIAYLRYNSKVFALRYGVEFTKNLYSGPEISGMVEKYDNNMFSSSKLNFGIFTRYTILGIRKICPLLESGIFYQSGKYHSQARPEPDWKKDKVGWYASAGVGINLYKRKVTLDLMVKYSPDVQFESTHFTPTYKINYHIHP